jgi:Putative Flp pilus-assembly TadE/G-like
MTSNGSGMADTSLTARAFTDRRAGVERLAGQPPERGSASLIGLALCAFVVIATLVTADVVALAFARARAQTAADLAALAAVTPHPSGPLEQPGGTPPGRFGLDSPAERASAVAAGNGANVLACSCGPLEATISVGVRARLIPFGATVQVRAYARAVLRSSMAPTTSVPPAATSGRVAYSRVVYSPAVTRG